MNAKVIAIIPCYQEAARVGEVVRRARPRVDRVVVIDDGSTDATAEEAKRAGAIVVRHAVNQGKGHAIRTGLDHAVENGFDLFLFLDGDGQHNPDEIPKLLEAQRASNASIVVGNRMCDVRRMPMVRKWTNQFTSWILSRMAGQRIPDSQCGFRLLHKSVVPDLHIETEQFETESEMLIQAGQRGHRIVPVTIGTIYEGQEEQSKIRPILDAARFCRLDLEKSETQAGLRAILAMKPKSIQQINDELAILWEDGHESYYKLEALRRACPCASCGGERDVLGTVHRGNPQKLTPASFQLKGIEPVGGYAIRPTWGDGHATGLFPFDALRKNCPCDQCVAARKANSA